jgi:hemerythrin-like domain-containing protein
LSAESPIDTSDMVAVHEVFRRALISAPQTLAAVDIGDDDKVAVVASYYANVLAFLHVHHQGEDALLWPKLLERVRDPAVVRRIAAQHLDVDGAVASAESRLGDWAAGPTARTAKSLAAALSTLGEVLGPHLDEEEREILPLAAVHLSAQEWAELPAYGIRNFAGDKLWLVIGLIREAMTPEQRTDMLAQLPASAVDFWTSFGRPQYEAFIATVRG